MPVEEQTEAEPQHEDHQKAQHEDQKAQAQGMVEVGPTKEESVNMWGVRG